MKIFLKNLHLWDTGMQNAFHCDILLDLWKSCIYALTIWTEGKRQLGSLLMVLLFGCAVVINPTELRFSFI